MNLALYKIRSTQNTSIYIKFSLSLSNLEPNFFLFLLHSLFKTAAHLVWSVFGLTNLETMESHDTWSSTIVDVLYVMFLILSVIMLINMLVALLTNTYNKVEVNNFAVPFWPCSQGNLHYFVIFLPRFPQEFSLHWPESIFLSRVEGSMSRVIFFFKFSMKKIVL